MNYPLQARRRTAEMSTLFRSYSRYDKERIGERHRVLVCELATDQEHYVGHNKYYEHFLIPAQKCLLGKFVEVRIVEVSKFYMKAVLVKSDISSWLSSSPVAGISFLPHSYWTAILSTVMSILIFWLLLL